MVDLAAIEVLTSALHFGDGYRAKGLDLRAATVNTDFTMDRLHVAGDLRFAGARCVAGVRLRECTIWGSVDFSAATVGSALDLAETYVKGTLRLTDAKAEELVIEMCDVGTVAAERIHIASWTAGTRCRVRGELQLDEARFGGPVAFGGACVDGNVAWESSKCDDQVQLLGVTVRGDASFSHSTFEGDVLCNGGVFEGDLDFIRCVFKRDWSTAGARCGGKLWCNASRFESAGGVGKMRVEKEFFLGESTWMEPASFDIETPVVRADRADFRASFDLITNASVSLENVRFGPGSRVRGGLFWTMEGGRGVVTASGEAPLAKIRTLRGTDVTNLVLAHVDLSRCRLANAHNLDKLRFDGRVVHASQPPQRRWSRRRTLFEEHIWRSRHGYVGWHSETEEEHLYWGTPSASAIASMYRALRKGQEDAKDTAGAADFYYGEMEMRRLARRAEMYIASGERRWAEWTTATAEHALLWLYWAVSGYGLRAWRALAALVVVLLAASVIFRYAGFPGDTHTYAASLRFSVQSAMSLLRGTDEPLTPTGEWVALALRLLGPLLFGLALLAVRGRVRR